MNKPRFNGTPVASLDSLSAMLGIERKRLDWIVKSVSMSYKQFKVETGKNKKERQIFEPKRSLKGIQKKINKEIFEKIDYPHYLHGALSGRDYISNAAVHTREGANKQVISSQVDSLIKISRIWANFFPANTS
ncbi:hypothetical protein ACRWXL_25245, partial [Escherichia coli]